MLAPFVLGLFAAKAQKATIAAEGTPLENSLLWKISGKDLSAASYLFGTIHLICPEDYTWTDAMSRAFGSAEQVVMELDMDDPNLQVEMSRGMMLDPGQSLKDYFTEEEYRRLNQFSTDSLGMPLEVFQGMEPFTLLSIFMIKTVACDIPASYEGNLVKMAAEQQKEVLGLESVSDQLQIFESMDVASIKSYLLDMAKNWDSARGQYTELVAAYKAQDITKLHRLVAESPEVAGQLDAFLYDRNEKWIPLMREIASDKPTFFAVGAGHLGGSRGVIRLLRAAGYTVEPVE